MVVARMGVGQGQGARGSSALPRFSADHPGARAALRSRLSARLPIPERKPAASLER